MLIKRTVENTSIYSIANRYAYTMKEAGTKKRRYWLMKSEPGDFSIDDLKREKRTMWDGVRNYQARNFMRDDMSMGDMVLFYHSNSNPVGIAGVAKVCSAPYPDPTAFDKRDSHYDPKSKKEAPTWILIDVCFVKKFNEVMLLSDLRTEKSLRGMLLFQKGQRLSVQPVDKKHFDHIVNMAR